MQTQITFLVILLTLVASHQAKQLIDLDVILLANGNMHSLHVQLSTVRVVACLREDFVVTRSSAPVIAQPSNLQLGVLQLKSDTRLARHTVHLALLPCIACMPVVACSCN